MKKEKTESSLELAKWIAQILDRKGGQEIVIIDTTYQSSVADYLIITTGTSQRHMESLLESPCKELKQFGFPPLSIEGEGTNWFLADLGDIVLHIFDEATRKYFDIEGMWENAPRVQWDEKSSQKLVQV